MQIKAFREKRQISQADLAKKAGITRAYLCQLERGTKKNPSAIVLYKIASSLCVSVEDLIAEKAG